MADCGCNTFPASLGNVTFEASVGIGTTNPQTALHIRTSAVPLIFDESDQSGATGYWRLPVDGGELRIDQNTATARDFSTYRTPFFIDPSGNLQLGGVDGSGTALATLYVGANAGNVGIGTTPPRWRPRRDGRRRRAGQR